MIIINKAVLREYKRQEDMGMLDWFTRYEESGGKLFQQFESHRWHMQQVEKRCVYHYIYSNIFSLDFSDENKVLDIGGGITSLTTVLSAESKYTLCDPQITPKQIKAVNKFSKEYCGKTALIPDDWIKIRGTYDLVIANDIFPNVDQRLERFLARFIPRCRRMLLSLTSYDNGRFYPAKRDSGEVLTVKAWDSREVLAALKPYVSRSNTLPTYETLLNSSSVFKNGRKVFLIALDGGIK